jgi:hypothetical protein
MRKAIVQFCNEFSILMMLALVFAIMRLLLVLHQDIGITTPPKDYPPDTIFNAYQPADELYSI